MIKKFVIAAKTTETIAEYLESIKVPTNIDPSFFAGELKDLLSQLTSSYSFLSSMVDVGNYVVNLLNEGIEFKTNECVKQLQRSSAPTQSTKKERTNSVRGLPIGELEICGETVFKKCNIQDIIEYKVRCEYLRDRLKSMMYTIDKSMSVGNTVLSYNKQEMAKLYNV